ncbi:hypothetical protein [Salipiger thiooxidans]|uniref:hypothetical protein n=1 Tax=Salipiger thiooxidans TaxID=282683 RepID=UPI001CD249BD|nr:hypothetical protein [Salipiger thiooxidans]MCA0851164.1 hypothetical protein [Salipiger thiooxidans]
MEKDADRDRLAAVHKLDGHRDAELGEDTGRVAHEPSVYKGLKDVLNKPREKLWIEDAHGQGKDCEIDREIERDPGLCH